MQCVEEGNQGRDFMRAKVSSESGHVSVTLKHLTHQLIVVQPVSDSAEIRPSFSARAIDGVAISALLALHHGRAHVLKRGPAHNEFRLDRDAAPRVHMR